MTVQELLDAADYCDIIEVIVRRHGHGKWLQGYRVGRCAKIFPSEITAEVREIKGLKEYSDTLHDVPLKAGEVVDVMNVGFLPMKVICKDCHKLPPQIGNLEVCDFQPRHIPSFHKNQLTHNEFALDINCYPDNYTPMVEVKESVNDQLEGQISIFDYEVKDEV